MVDLHTHILPGLDDGPTDVTETLAMCRAAVDDGTTTVVATPHMAGGLYHVTREAVLDGVRCLRARLEAEAVPLLVEPGADIHITPDLPDLLREGRLVTVGDRPVGSGAYVMLELPHMVIPQGVLEVLFAVQVMGVTPMISHPERNFEVQNDPDVVRPWVAAGTVLQLTAASVVGDFGRRARRCAHDLLRSRLAHVVASDAHSAASRPMTTSRRSRPMTTSRRSRPPGLSRARAVVASLLSAEETEEMFVRRPPRILAGDNLDLPEPAEPRPTRKERWFSWRR